MPVRLLHKILGRIDGVWAKHLFKQHGKHVSIVGKIDGYLKNVVVGDDVFIDEKVCFFCSRANVVIKNHVLISRETLFITGRHRTNIVGKYISEITDKEKEDSDDQDIVVNDDVWIGARATILHGVTIGEGAVVAANSVVTHDVPPFAVVAGVPAKIIKMRFSNEEIKLHKRMLESKKDE